MVTSFQTYPVGEKRRGTVRLTRHDDVDTSRPEVAPEGARRSQWKLTDGESLPACTVQANYRIATRSISQITLKFVWKLKNL